MSCRKGVAFCPVCGAENACCLVDSATEWAGRNKPYAGREPYAGNRYPIEDCWCSKVEGKLNRKVLADSLDNFPTSCICQKCWEKYQEK